MLGNADFPPAEACPNHSDRELPLRHAVQCRNQRREFIHLHILEFVDEERYAGAVRPCSSSYRFEQALQVNLQVAVVR